MTSRKAQHQYQEQCEAHAGEMRAWVPDEQVEAENGDENVGTRAEVDKELKELGIEVEAVWRMVGKRNRQSDSSTRMVLEEAERKRRRSPPEVGKCRPRDLHWRVDGTTLLQDKSDE